MTQPGTFWGSDVPISMPTPPADPVYLDFGGFGLTINGITHNLSVADLEKFLTPNFLPPEGEVNG